MIDLLYIYKKLSHDSPSMKTYEKYQMIHLHLIDLKVSNDSSSLNVFKVPFTGG